MIQTAPIFTDHMVLQRDKNVAVFGTGTAGESVRVSLPAQNRTVSGCVGGDGTWCVYLPPLTAGTGMTLEVAGAENQLVYTDVAVGEVWLAGGQSNMEFMLKDAKGGAEALQHCAESGVRCFRVPRNTFPDAAYAQEFAESRWELATPETAGVWSAVAYWAAQELAQRLGVPVGIVGCNYGGSSVSCWMPEEDLERHAAGHPYLKDYQDAVAGKTDAEMIAAYDDYLVYHAAWTERDDTLPFLLVQLPMFAYEDTLGTGTWCILREAQMNVFRTVRNTGIAVALDCGEMGNIHPADKKPVAHRLALQARHLVYGETELEAFGPLYAGSVVQDGSLTVFFDHGQGMTFHGKPLGFELAGADGVYHPAQAVLDGASVRLTCAEVPVPVSARYAWQNYGPVSLFGANGIPAAPFRTTPAVLPLLQG